MKQGNQPNFKEQLPKTLQLVFVILLFFNFYFLFVIFIN